jgi:hypothetical protein
LTANLSTTTGDFEESASCCAPRKALAVILLFGAALRFGLAIAFGGYAPVITDAQDYNRLAVGLVETGSYASETGELISLRPPLFPGVVAAIYSVAGTENYLAVSLFHAAISLVTTFTRRAWASLPRQLLRFIRLYSSTTNSF